MLLSQKLLSAKIHQVTGKFIFQRDSSLSYRTHYFLKSIFHNVL